MQRVNNMRIIISGSREFENQFLFEKLLSQTILKKQCDLFFSTNQITFVLGGAVGVDSMALSFVKKNSSKYNWKYIEIIPDWKDMTPPCVVGHSSYHGEFNKLAGFKRNQKMIDCAMEEIDRCLIAFPKGKSFGTRDTIQRAKKSGIDTTVFEIKSRMQNDI